MLRLLKYFFLILGNLHWRHGLWAGIIVNWLFDVPPDDQNNPCNKQGTGHSQQCSYSGKEILQGSISVRTVCSLLQTWYNFLFPGNVMETDYDICLSSSPMKMLLRVGSSAS